MIHSDEENKRWWAQLAESEKHEIFDRIEEKATSETLLAVVGRIRATWQKGQAITPTQIETLRKWA